MFSIMPLLNILLLGQVTIRDLKSEHLLADENVLRACIICPIITFTTKLQW
jgi:hypothetical protein